MTQPAEAVGGANDTVVAAEPTIEDRFSAITGEEQELPEEEEADGDEPTVELTEEDVAELEAEGAEGEEPTGDDKPIQPPVSLTAEEKEAFKTWPREAQEAISRRVGELEKGFQSKAQEAAQTRFQVEQQALGHIQQLNTTYLQQLQTMLPQVPDEPSAHLQVEDPYAYADQMEARKWAIAQHNQIMQQIQSVGQQQGAMENAVKAQSAAIFSSTLQEHFPEFLDPEKGPELRTRLGSTAIELGYSSDQLTNADAQDVLAMKKASEWKAKADKLDTLMAKQMEKVREAKKLPRVSRPGVAQGRGVAENQRYATDRQAMRGGDRDAAARVFGKFL